jgi:D-beta-D-heptose 7-phosphate kinase/D-beta-D-heptose 1-phosphate adenosyltransferase
MSLERINALLAAMRGRRIVVLGDLMLDEYVWGDARRISPDAPVPVVEVRRRSHAVGGAANVAHNVAVAGGTARIVGLIGDDAAGKLLIEGLATAGVDVAGIVRDPTRPTTVKTRVVARGQHVLRLDAEERTPPAEGLRIKLAAALVKAIDGADAILVSDYAKGVVTGETLAATIDQSAGRIPVIVDPKSLDFGLYRGCTAITPNRAEAEAATRLTLRTDGDLDEAVQRIRAACGARDVLITLGDEGMILSHEGRPIDRIAARAREVYDVTGAGDTVLAYFGLGLGAGINAAEAARLANVAAGIAVAKVGTSAVTPSEIAADAEGSRSTAKAVDLAQAVARCEHLRSAGKRIVFTNGCFDLLHAGHVHLLERAKALGDVLVVALNSDESVRRLKGPERPLVGAADRVKVIGALDAVDLVIVFDDDTPLETIRALRPDVLVKGGDYTVGTIVGAEDVIAYGGRVETIPLVAGRSTSSLVESVRRGGPS